MLIVIPTYKRNQCLRWVLQSLVQCRVESIQEPITVLVVNNYPPAATEIEQIVDQFAGHRQFIWKILYREKTLMPVDNWYSAIFANASPDEVVFINSDDDLLLPDSLEMRYLEIIRQGAELLLSKFMTNVFFVEQGSKVLCKDEINRIEFAKSMLIGFDEIDSFMPQHLSNHCYRNTQNFRVAYEKAMSWCEELNWLDYNNRTIFFPLYLACAIVYSGGKVAGIPIQAILRGRDLNEIINSPFGVPSWNHGFIHSCALIVLGNADLYQVTQLNNLRVSYLQEYVRWYLTYFFDSRLKWKVVLETQRRAGVTWSQILSPTLLQGISILVKDLVGLRGFKLSRIAKHESIGCEEFMVKILEYGGNEYYRL